MNYLLKGIALGSALLLSPQSILAEGLEQGPILGSFSPAQLNGEANIWQIAQTREGQIIASGERISFYQRNEWMSLSSPRKQAIRGLLVDGATLWVASNNEVGELKLPLTSASRYVPLPVPSLAGAGEFWYIAKSGATLVATTNEDVWFISPATKEAHQTHLPNKYHLTLLQTPERLIVVQPGVALWEVKAGQLVAIDNPLPDKSDTYWLWSDEAHVVTARGLFAKERDDYKLVENLKALNQAAITSVTRWGKYLAIATYAKGLVLLNTDSGQTNFVTRALGLPTLSIVSVTGDNAGRLWAGTNSGISVFETMERGLRVVPKDFPLAAVRSDGILINHEDYAEYHHDDGKEERLPRAFALTTTRHGLALGFLGKIRVGEDEFSTPGNKVDLITELPDGNLLVAVSDRLYYVNRSARTTELLKEPRAEVSGLTVAGGTLWAATFDGTLYRSPVAPPFSFTRISALPNNSAAALHHLEQTVIVASSDGVRFGDQLAFVTNTQGVRNPRLAQSKGALWLVADQDGEHRLGRLVQTGDAVAWETVEAKGLAALPDIHYFSASDDALMFCGGSTILELNASELKPAYRLDAPRLEFTFADAETGAAITLPAPPENLSAEKNGLTFTATLPFDEFGEKPAYERRLLPTETTWIPTKAGEKVSYPSLSARDYTLEVRATHLGHKGAAVTRTFTVLPPWYASPGAFAAYGAFVLLSSYSLFRLRTHQIRQRNIELEAVVQQRTQELAQASAAKTEFLASMSHEIRNPMNGVIGLVNILREETPTPRQAHTLKLLHGCAEQLRSTVDDILDFSKIEAGHVVLERTTFDLLDTLEASAATIDPSGRKIQFQERPPAGLSLRGDAGKLRQIFANYLSNALKYGIPPEARVSTILVPADDNVRLTLSVTSSGPTIAKDTLDGFFESFTRGADAMERNIHGTGLGLAICKRYAQAMGGEVGAVSTNGETTFYLNIPFAKASEAAPMPAVASPVSALPAKALAIEDEDYNRIVLGSILTKMNYTVDWATTGAEALQLARENGYDIVLTDYRLPDTNGVDLAREILRLCPEPKPAVFAVTAYSTLERREECLRAGMAGFISKPITLEKLRVTLANWGDKQLTTISLEATRRPLPPQPPAAIESGWIELKRAAMLDTKRAAELAHRLNNVCRAFNYLDLAEQLELLEGALERNEPAAQFLQACERLLRPSEVGQSS